MPLYGHPIGRKLEAWWKEHGFRHDDPEWQRFLSMFGENIKLKCQEMGEEHSNNGRFGMSKAGGCTRAASLALLGREKSQPPGSTLTTFFFGHLAEIIGIATLECAGIPVSGLQGEVTIEPFMASKSDGRVTVDGREMILSVKSSAYKASTKTREGWRRFGFPQLPFDGVKSAQVSWWAQAQAEMFGSGLNSTLVLVVAKDIVLKFRDDDYLGEKGNGSLVFYAEVIDRDDDWIGKALLPTWREAWSATKAGREVQPRYLNGHTGEFALLPEPGIVDPNNIWGGPNQKATGSFSPCGGCDFAASCRELGHVVKVIPSAGAGKENE